MRRATVGVAVLVVGVLLGCASSRHADERTVDDTIESTVPRPARRSAAAMDALRAHPDVAVHLRSVATGIETSDLPGSSPLRVETAAVANGVTRLGLPSQPGAFLELAPLGAGSSAPIAEGNTLVFPSALPATDVVHVVERGRFEELRVLYDDAAPTEARWKVRLGPAIRALRLVDGRIDAIDGAGRVALVGHPPWAEDARGVRRAVSVHVTPPAQGDEWTLVLSLDAHELVHPIVLDPTWSVVAPMSTPRRVPGALALPDGRVLVAGGSSTGGGGPLIASAEIYDPAGNTWTSAGTMPVAMAGPIVPLPGGHALMAGSSAGPTSNAVAWQGGTTWKNAGPMSTARAQHVLVSLADGRVLAAGGRHPDTAGDSTALSTAEVYDPATNAWTATGPMLEARAQAHALLLATGKVLVVGGEAGGTFFGDVTNGNHALATAELYDPSTNTWAYTSSMVDRRANPAVFFSGGKVRVMEGFDAIAGGGTTVLSQTTYDPSTATWSTPTTFTRLISFRTVPLTDGRVAFPGTSELAVYDPATDVYTYAGSNAVGRSGNSVAALPGGRMLLVGGLGGGTVYAEADIWSQAALGASCVNAYDCLSGACVDGACCGTPSCPAGSVCNSALAAGSCRKSPGQTCAADADCAGGHCVDGVCCDRACGGQCEACDDPFAKGTCKTIAGAAHGTRTPCSDGAGDACKATVCNGSDATTCHAPAAGTVACGANACTGGIERHVGTCGATGACSGTSTGCGVYACGTTTCKTSCSVSGDCAAGYWCSGSACVAVLGLGKACSDPAACGAPLACVDGVCCGSPSCVTGSSCALPGHEGTCIRKAGTTCSVDAECASGFCTDGVCCDARCDGQCEACDNGGSAGTCSATTGTPHGGRSSCARDDKNPCGSAACDGITRASCAGRVGAEQACRAQSCDATKLVQKAVCDGKGACPAEVTATCSGYTCRDATSCRTDCRDDGDCASGYRCQSGACKPATDTCSVDGTQALPVGAAPISCAPYFCRSGACLTACGTSSDCAPGLVCSFSTKTCESLPAAGDAGDSGGGCSTSTRGGGTGSLFAMALAMTWAALRRRRRAAVAAMALTATACGRATPETTEKPEKPVADRSAASILQTARQASPSFRGFGVSTMRAPTQRSPLAGVSAATALRVTLPRSGGDPLHLALDGDAWLDVVPDDAKESRPAMLEEGAVIVTGVLPHTTLLWSSGSGSAEELRVLDDASAPTSWRYRLRSGSSLARIRVREGRIEALDAGGVVRLASAPMWAIDAAGIRRDVSLSLAHGAPNEAVVVASIDTTGLRHPIVVDPVWSSGPSMSTPRVSHTATTLPGGKILVTGGMGNLSRLGAPLKSAEIYDPATNTWTTAPSMRTARQNHAAVLVAGQVLVVGGDDNSSTASGFVNATATAEVFDPATSTWSDVAALPEARTFLQAAPAGTGKAVVFAGTHPDGAGGETVSKLAYLFSMSTKAWSSGGVLAAEHTDQLAVTVASGAVIVIGGVDSATGAQTTAVDRYDPTANTWSAAAPMSTPRFEYTATVLADGKRVLVTGGTPTTTFGGTMASTEIYDSTANTWTAGPNMTRRRDSHEAALISSGKVVVVSGEDFAERLDTYEIFDPVKSTFTLGGPFQLRIQSTISTLPDGSVLFVGGLAGPLGDFPVTATTARFALEPLGVACNINDQCVSGSCVDLVCCSTASCAAGSTCRGVSPGTCSKNDGIACSAASDCASGFCVDGVCCESACASQCAACDVPGNVGKCRPAKGAPHGSRAACTATPSTCGLACDGTDVASCHPAASSAPCGAAACTAGTESHAGTCSGAGSCNDTPKSCGGFTCDATTCKTTCALPADCAAGYACSAGTCVPLPGKGKDCSGTGACGPGLSCVAGVCCGSPACAADSVCPLAVGDCVKIKGATCTADAQCVTGHCVDSVCCDGACGGPCGACNLAGREGTCTAVAGAPKGTRTCPKDASNPCSDALCDGSDPSKCNVKVGSDVTCKKAACGGGKANKTSFCDGKGSCPAPLVSDCGAYTCNADGTACRERCTTASDCVPGAFCRDGKCQLFAGACSADGASVVSTEDGSSISCAPFRCVGTTCVTSCTTSEDCAAGAVCDTDSHACAPVASGGDGGSGGCVFSPRAGAAGSTATGVLLLALARCARRRRRVSRSAW